MQEVKNQDTTQGSQAHLDSLAASYFDQAADVPDIDTAASGFEVRPQLGSLAWFIQAIKYKANSWQALQRVWQAYPDLQESMAAKKAYGIRAAMLAPSKKDLDGLVRRCQQLHMDTEFKNTVIARRMAMQW
jgi:hypothetical protein